MTDETIEMTSDEAIRKSIRFLGCRGNTATMTAGHGYATLALALQHREAAAAQDDGAVYRRNLAVKLLNRFSDGHTTVTIDVDLAREIVAALGGTS